MLLARVATFHDLVQEAAWASPYRPSVVLASKPRTCRWTRKLAPVERCACTTDTPGLGQYQGPLEETPGGPRQGMVWQRT